jgi:hypothetical protein
VFARALVRNQFIIIEVQLNIKELVKIHRFYRDLLLLMSSYSCTLFHARAAFVDCGSLCLIYLILSLYLSYTLDQSAQHMKDCARTFQLTNATLCGIFCCVVGFNISISYMVLVFRKTICKSVFLNRVLTFRIIGL